MELKLITVSSLSSTNNVLIVPFMELKLIFSKITIVSCPRLNRTFYGIETGLRENCT